MSNVNNDTNDNNDNNKINEFKRNQLKKLSFEAYMLSKKASEILYEDPTGFKSQVRASTLINKAISYMSAVRAIYYSNIEILDHDDVDEVLAKFSIFEEEFITCFSTDHNQQWTSGDFERYEETFLNSLLNSNLN